MAVTSNKMAADDGAHRQGASRPSPLQDLFPEDVRDSLRQAARRRGVRLLFSQGLIPIWGTFAAMLVVAWLTYQYTDISRHVTLLWLAAVFIVNLLRHWMILRFQKAQPRGDAIEQWHWRYVGLQLLQGVVLGAYFAFATQMGPDQVGWGVALIAIGLSIVSLLILGTSMPAYLAFTVPILLLPGLVQFAEGAHGSLSVAAFLGICLVVMPPAVRRWRTLMLDATESGMLNQRLARSLLRARSQAEEYTAELAQEVDERARMQMALAEMRERAQVTLEAIGDGVIVCDSDGNIDYLNPSAAIMLDVQGGRALGQPVWQALSLTDDRSGEPVDLQQITEPAADHRLPVDLMLHRRDSIDTLSITATLSPVPSNDGTSGGWVLVLHDQSELRGLTRALAFQAAHDGLTKLINRREFERQLERQLARSTEAQPSALLFLDLDKFKVINDTSGHAAGDQLLADIARRISAMLDENEILARLGGDEFGLLMVDASADAAKQRAQELVGAIDDYRMSWDDELFSVGASVGIVELDGSIANVGDALSRADNACYIAKDRGGSRFYVHQDDDAALTHHRSIALWLNRLQAAMAERRFELYVQPIVSLGEQHVDEQFGEILLRLRTPDGRIVTPNDFLPAAERYRLMPQIDQHVVLNFMDWLENKRGGFPFTGFMVNLSGQSLSDIDFHVFLEGALRARPMLAKWLCFEVTESAVVSDISVAVEFMERIGELGVRFALDDFGSGLSSLNYLKRLPVDFLKIDGSFVRNIAEDDFDQLMVQSVARWSNALGIRTIAEYVERPKLLSILRDLGIDFAQGYALGKPQPLPSIGNIVGEYSGGAAQTGITKSRPAS